MLSLATRARPLAFSFSSLIISSRRLRVSPDPPIRPIMSAAISFSSAVALAIRVWSMSRARDSILSYAALRVDDEEVVVREA